MLENDVISIMDELGIEKITGLKKIELNEHDKKIALILGLTHLMNFV